ncbi:WG repeat-containing protein, partial [Paenibacillus mendelii]
PLEYYGRYGDVNVRPKFVHNPFFNDGLAALMNKDGKFGYIDKEGKVVIPFEYDNTQLFTEGFAAVNKDDKWGFVNKKGEVVIPLEYDWAFIFEDGLIPARKDGKFGFIDKTGNTIVPFEFHFERGFLGGFSEGLAPVEKDGKKGYIDKMGKVVIPFELEYDVIGRFHNGLAGVAIGKGPEIPMVEGESEEDFRKRFNALNKQRWGFIDKTGAIIVPIEYGGILVFSEEFIIVEKKDGKQSYIDYNGNVPFATDFDVLSGFYEGFAKIKKDGKYGYIDKTGDVVIPIVYEDASHFKEGYAAVKKDGKYGYIDKTGDMIVPLEYNSAGLFNEGLSVVKKDGKWGILEIETEE